MDKDVLKSILKFREERDWEQFHSPKNLAMSIAIEAGELMEHFQWTDVLPAAEVPVQDRRLIAEELADVAIYLNLLAHDLDIDLDRAVQDKILKNGEKYPAEKYRGKYRA